MRRPSTHPPDEPIVQSLRAGLWGIQPPSAVRVKLLAAAAIEADLRRQRLLPRVLPGWISSSTARRLRERRISMQGLKHGYIAAALNYRVSW